MKAVEWQRFFEEQKRCYGKVVFTSTELCNAASQDLPSLRAALRRLVANGIVQRYVDGRYGLPGSVSAEDLVRSLDQAAYISGMFALHRHQLITQVPTEITCFTLRRHNRSRIRDTPLGRIVFVCVTGPAYAYPERGVVASPEQALCDFVYLCRQRRLTASSLVTFQNLDLVSGGKLQEHFSRYPGTVQQEVEQILRPGVGSSLPEGGLGSAISTRLGIGK
ncbi:MAG: hypothetical protein HQ559_18570 [Lentisphaerae bacterium]|nr:hypothetical protein [Lentisphaerota bacterium]